MDRIYPQQNISENKTIESILDYQNYVRDMNYKDKQIQYNLKLK